MPVSLDAFVRATATSSTPFKTGTKVWKAAPEIAGALGDEAMASVSTARLAAGLFWVAIAHTGSPSAAIAAPPQRAPATAAVTHCRAVLNAPFNQRIHNREEWGRCEELLYPKAKQKAEAETRANNAIAASRATTDLDREAIAAAGRYWAAEYALCGKDYVTRNAEYRIVAYRGVHQYVRRGKLTPADRLNGYTWRGTLYMEYALHRERAEMGDDSWRWEEWKNDVLTLYPFLNRRGIAERSIITDELMRAAGDPRIGCTDVLLSCPNETRLDRKDGHWLVHDKPIADLPKSEEVSDPCREKRQEG